MNTAHTSRMAGLFGFWEEIGAHEPQIHQASLRNAGVTPIGDRWLSDLKHARNRGGAAELVNDFRIWVSLFHSDILVITKLAVNSHDYDLFA